MKKLIIFLFLPLCTYAQLFPGKPVRTDTLATNLTTWDDASKSFQQMSGATLKSYFQNGVIKTWFIQTANKTVTNTTTETSIIGSGIGSLTIPANSLVAGKVYRLRVWGKYSTPAISVGSLTVKNYIGGAVIATVTANALASLASNLDFFGESIFVCRSSGTTGTVMSPGNLIYQVGGNLPPYFNALSTGLTAVTVNTTVANTFDSRVTWSVANANHSITSVLTTLEELN